MGEGTPRRITGLQEQRGRGQRVDVLLDGAFAFSLERATVVAHGLRAGLILDDEQVVRLRSLDTREQAHEAALRLLSFRPRSERELRQRLGAKGFAPEVIDETLARLARVGLVDDRAFAAFWVSNRQSFRPRGERYLKQELQTKGLDRQVIAEALSAHPVDEAAEALEAGRRKLPSLNGCDHDTFRRRLGGYLSRRGYSWEVAGPIIRQLWRELGGEESET